MKDATIAPPRLDRQNKHTCSEGRDIMYRWVSQTRARRANLGKLGESSTYHEKMRKTKDTATSLGRALLRQLNQYY